MLTITWNCNGDPTTEYGGKRQALGLDAFNVHLWYVGNEAYFFGYEYRNSTWAAKRTDELIAAVKSGIAYAQENNELTSLVWITRNIMDGKENTASMYEKLERSANRYLSTKIYKTK